MAGAELEASFQRKVGERLMELSPCVRSNDDNVANWIRESDIDGGFVVHRYLTFEHDDQPYILHRLLTCPPRGKTTGGSAGEI